MSKEELLSRVCELVRQVEEARFAGGAYAKHWAFVPPQKREAERGLPATAAIDAFAGAHLATRGIEFAAEADRGTLARRAALVLTGLPPEPGLLAAFLADDRVDAYERFVDELLASPRYGEHQARYWLEQELLGTTSYAVTWWLSRIDANNTDNGVRVVILE